MITKLKTSVALLGMYLLQYGLDVDELSEKT